MGNDPISRLKLVRDEIDRVFGDGYAQANPALVAAATQSAASDWAAARLANAIEHIAAALVVEDEPGNNGIVSAQRIFRMQP